MCRRRQEERNRKFIRQVVNEALFLFNDQRYYGCAPLKGHHAVEDVPDGNILPISSGYKLRLRRPARAPNNPKQTNVTVVGSGISATLSIRTVAVSFATAPPADRN